VSEGSVEEGEDEEQRSRRGRRRRADEEKGAGERGDFEYQRCMGCDFLGRTDVPNARNREGRGADWTEESVEEQEEVSRWAEESGECWGLDCQRCMGCASFGRTAVFGQWN
jgi:hypothetical protein